MLSESGHDYEALAAKLNAMGIEISARIKSAGAAFLRRSCCNARTL